MPDFEALGDEEKKRFQYAYCGLCRVLNNNYGKAGQVSPDFMLSPIFLL